MNRFVMVAALIAMSITTAAKAVDYNTFCEIADGEARGYVSVTSYDSLTISGYVTFRVYAADGDLLDTERKYEYAYIYHDTELVSSIDVDDESASCSFDVSAAVSEPSPDPEPNPSPVDYSTDCAIAAGKAYGYVTVHSYDSLTVSGNVEFTIFDSDGRVIDRESSYEYAYIYHARELVDEMTVDEDARFCSFDVSGAVDSN